MKSYKDIVEALKGNQHKIDKNKNGKIDAHDFKLLRKEESELTEATVKTQKYSWGTMKTVHHGADFSIPLHPEHHQAIAKLKDNQEHKFKDETGRHWTAKRMGDDVHFQGANNGDSTKVKHEALKESEERMARADYKVSPSGRKSHKEIVFDNSEEKEEMKEEMTDAQMKKREEIVKSMKKNMAGFKNRYGDRAKNVMYATATKMAMKEDTELDEAKEKTEYDYEGDMARGQLQSIVNNAQRVHDMLEDNDNLPEWVQSKITLAEDYISTVSNYMSSELDEQAPVAPVPDRKYIKGTPEHKAYMATKKPRVGHPTNVKEEAEELEERNKENAIKRKMMDASRGARFKAQGNYVPDAEPQHKTAQAHNKAIGRAIRQMSNEEVEQTSISFKDFMSFINEGRAQYMVKATHKDTGRTKVTTYVADKDEKEHEVRARAEREHRPAGYSIDSMRRKDIEAHGEGDEEETTNSTIQKRGRGRPAGSKSGARGPRIK